LLVLVTKVNIVFENGKLYFADLFRGLIAHDSSTKRNSGVAPIIHASSSRRKVL